MSTLEVSAQTLLFEDKLAIQAQVDRAAFTAVYDHFFRRVYNYVRYRVGDPDATDDVTAQIFEQVLHHLPRYHARRGSFAAWLFRIARNAVYDHLRQGKRHPQVRLETVEEQASDLPGPEEQAEDKLNQAHLLSLIAKLTDREQEIIALKFGAGLTNRHIADLVKLSESNVGVILYRAITTLRRKMREEGGERDE